MRSVARPWTVPRQPESGTLLGAIVAARGLTDADIDPPKMGLGPFGGINDMQRAVDVIERCRRQNIAIAICGDYDTDGVAATALLVIALRRAGIRVVPVVPDRVNGYGLRMHSFEKANAAECGAIITVDAGTHDREIVAMARQAGMHVVVTDHHPVHADRVAEPDALVNPAHPGSTVNIPQLCGTGVAFGLMACCGAAGVIPEALDLISLAAVATIADVVPLTGLNRNIVRAGLANAGALPGVAALFSEVYIVDPSAEDVKFQIAPRLNAAGRIDTAVKAFNLLASESRVLLGSARSN